MAARSIASLSLTFGLVSIPVKVYLATETSTAIKFKLLAPGGGARLRQQYVSDEPLAPVATAATTERSNARAEPADATSSGARYESRPASEPLETDAPSATAILPHRFDAAAPRVVERAEMVKGYEYERGKFVIFTSAELEALEAESRQTIDIVEFVPADSIDPIYYEKAYFLAPDERAAKPYSLLMQAMQQTGRTALAKWAWRAKEYVVQIRPTAAGLVLQQLLYADEVRAQQDLRIDLVPVGQAELQLATQIIEQISSDAYDPTRFVDEEKQRILAAVERKVAGQEGVMPVDGAHAAATGSGAQVVDLMEALRASLAKPSPPKPAPGTLATTTTVTDLPKRKPPRRASAEAAPGTPEQARVTRARKA